MYKCEICGKQTKKRNKMERHISYHEKELKFKCDECGKGFVELKNLRRHEFTHGNERDYHCEKCEKTYKTWDHLKRHKLKHQIFKIVKLSNKVKLYLFFIHSILFTHLFNILRRNIRTDFV